MKPYIPLEGHDNALVPQDLLEVPYGFIMWFIFRILRYVSEDIIVLRLLHHAPCDIGANSLIVVDPLHTAHEEP